MAGVVIEDDDFMADPPVPQQQPQASFEQDDFFGAPAVMFI